MLLEQQYRQHDEVVEVDRVERLEVAVVGGIEQGGVVVHRVVGAGERLLGGDKGVFPAGDTLLHLLFQFVVAALLAHQLTDQSDTVGGIEYGEARLVTEGA